MSTPGHTIIFSKQVGCTECMNLSHKDKSTNHHLVFKALRLPPQPLEMKDSATNYGDILCIGHPVRRYLHRLTTERMQDYNGKKSTTNHQEVMEARVDFKVQY